MTRVGTIAKGLGSLLVVALIVIGVPLVLVRIGAIPTTVPSLTGIWEGLSRPDLTGQGGVFVVLAILTWGCWATFTLSLLREIPAAVRSRGQRAARPLPGLSWSARPAALLVAAIVAMFVAAPLLTAAAPVAAAASLHNGPATPASGWGTVATATHHPTTAPNATPAAAHHASSTGSSAEAHPGASLSTSRSTSKPATSHSYTVKRHDTLWSIAEKQLGDPLRYTEIATLNPYIGPSHEIHVGLKLLLPRSAHAAADTHPAAAASTTPSSAASLAATEVVVEQGDTLSGLAAEHGVADWKAKVWPANAVRTEPRGKHLTDPNHIEVGWHLTVPGATTPSTPASAPAPAAAAPVTPAAAAPTPSAAMAPPHTPVAHDPDATRLTPDTEDPAGQVAPASTGQPSTPAEASATAAPQQRPVANAASAEQSRSSRRVNW